VDPTKAELEQDIVAARRRLDADVERIFHRVDEVRDHLHDLRRTTRSVALAVGATVLGITLVVVVTRLARRR